MQAEAVNPCLPCPCLAGVFMALVVCIVPVRKGEAKEAEAQPELEHLGEWMNPRGNSWQMHLGKCCRVWMQAADHEVQYGMKLPS